MKKIPTIFIRNPEKMSEVIDKPNPACQWVFDGEGVATRKYDGTCCMVSGGVLFKRREIKFGKPVPSNFVCSEMDNVTGKTYGWVPVDFDLPDNKWHFEAWSRGNEKTAGTYELVGPKIQGNPENYNTHMLVRHGVVEYQTTPRTFDDLKEWLVVRNIEGIVFHHPDGRMAKIKKRDFGLGRSIL